MTTPLGFPSGPPDKPAAKTDAIAEATKSLAPNRTHFAHRPDWQATLDDEADAQRDRSGGGA